jgi:uncharacterized protein YrrD
MLSALSLKDFAIRASDGRIGTLGDVLFDDSTWHVRWMVVHTGSWLAGRLALVRPPVIERADRSSRELVVRLTRAQVDGCPDILLDEPVSRQIEYGEDCYPEWDPSSGSFRYVAGFWGGMGVQVSQARLNEEKSMPGTPHLHGRADGDPHLRSVSAVIGNQVDGTDEPVGHVHDILLDSADWTVRAIIVDTRHWWPGKRLMIAPSAVRDISWRDQAVRLNIPRAQAQTSPVWEPADVVD